MENEWGTAYTLHEQVRYTVNGTRTHKLEAGAIG